MFWFPLQLLSERIQRETIINLHSSLCKLAILMNIGFSWEIFGKQWNIKYKNSSTESQVVPYGQTDMAKLIDAFRNFANAPKTMLGYVKQVT